MSYMSDVGVVMKGSDWNAFVDDIVANQEIEMDENLFFNRNRFLKNVKVITHEDGYVTLLWKYVKWDKEIDEIVEKFMNFLDDSENKSHYIRIGEGAGVHYPDIIDLTLGKGDNCEYDKALDRIDVNTTCSIILRGEPYYKKANED